MSERAEFQQPWEDEFKESSQHQQKALAIVSLSVTLLLSLYDLIIHVTIKLMIIMKIKISAAKLRFRSIGFSLLSAPYIVY